MEENDLTQPALPEGEVPQQPEGQPVEQALEPQPDVLRYKWKNEEVELPADAVRTIAERLGYDSEEAVLNLLQMGKDSSTVYKQAREYYERANRPQPQPPVEERWQSHVQRESRPQPQQPQPGEVDPIQLLQDLDRRTRVFDEYVQEQRQRAYYEQQQRDQQVVNTAMSEYSSFAKELKDKQFPEYKIPDITYLVSEADRMGMLRAGLPIGEVFRNLHKMMFAEDYAQAAVQKQMNRLRDPRARIPAAPPGPGATPPPANPKLGETLDSMPAIDFLRSLPEGKF